MNDYLQSMCKSYFKSIAKLKAKQSVREEVRVAYDHYRNKMQKLEKTYSKSNDAKKQEVYKRNIDKFNKAKEEFD